MKVLFNIKKLQLSKITAISDTGVPTYDTPLVCPGTVSLSLESESSSESIYADGIVYYTPSGSTTTTGTLENALFTEDILKAIFGYVTDSNGNLLETDAQTSEFGMQFACDSDDGEVFFTYYRVSANKPGLNLTTNNPSATINPQSISITASPITLVGGNTNVLKSHATHIAANYATYFNEITLPAIPPTSVV